LDDLLEVKEAKEVKERQDKLSLRRVAILRSRFLSPKDLS